MNLIVEGGLVVIQLCLIGVCSETENRELIIKQYDPDGILDNSEIDILIEMPEVLRFKAAAKYISKNRVLRKYHENLSMVQANYSLVEAEKERLGKFSVYYHFHCGVNSAKLILEFFNHEFIKGENSKQSGIMDMPKPPLEYRKRLPKLYRTLVTEQGAYDSLTTKSLVKTLASKWHYSIYLCFSRYLKNLKYLLNAYFENNKDKYGDLKSLYITFSASVSRSYRFFNYIYHSVLQRLSVKNFNMDDDDAFFKFLFEELPTYYFQLNDLLFINILLSARELTEIGKIDEKKQLHFLRYQNPNTGDSVILPFSDYCPPQKIPLPTEHCHLNYSFTTSTTSSKAKNV